MSQHKAVIDTNVGQYLLQITEILNTYFGEYDSKVYLYGSRAKGANHSASDIDLAVKSSDLPTYSISKAREAFFESQIPYKIDIVNLESVGQEFKKIIIREGVLIWES